MAGDLILASYGLACLSMDGESGGVDLKLNFFHLIRNARVNDASIKFSGASLLFP